MSGLDIAHELTLPLDAVTETFAILAVKRAGKSNAAVVMAEQMHDAGVPWVAVDPKGDWWGVRAAGDGQTEGLSVLVLGGQHGDVPLEPTAGRLVADLVVDERVTCVLDVSEMSKADQRRFLTDFADRLYRRNTEPLHVFCEEADEYIPQMVRGEAAKVVGAFETLVKRGGFRGIGITLVTQRSASLNKDVLTQAGTLFAMRTPSPQDRKAVLAWIDYHAASKDVVDELPTLEAGEAWVFSPQFLKTLTKIRFRRRRTFDSGATPKVGGRPRPPARLADVDLAAIKEAMAETIERAKADDPRELRRRIAELERQLRDKPTPEPVVEQVEVPALPDEQLDKIQLTFTEWAERLHESVEVVDRLLDTIVTTRAVVRPRASESVARPQNASPVRAPAPSPRAEADDGDVKVGKTEKKIMAVLAQYGPRSHRQTALLTGYSAKASTIGVAMAKLRKLGYAEPGQPYTATQAGLDALGPFDPLPTGSELLEHWRGVFGKTESVVLDVLLDVYPAATDLHQVCERTGYSPTASTVGVSMSKLRRVEIAEGWRLTDDFARAVGIA